STVAHQNVGPQMAKDTTITDWDNWHRTPAPVAARPDLIFGDSLQLDLGGQRIWLHHIPPAHTDGDVVVFLPWANVLHTGDLVEPGAPPFIDYWSGGSLAGMIAAADRILAMTDDQTRIVPGHGPVIGRNDVLAHRRMLVSLGDRVHAAIEAGKTLEQVQAEAPAREFEPLLGGPRGATRFVRVVYYGIARLQPK
ncbi:MAG TPA: MBL fold metallo-hydrolase, partial [Gemmatimonadales bacterium]